MGKMREGWLESVAASMKWGFLSDHIVDLYRYHRLADHAISLCKSHRPDEPLGRKWQNVDLAQGAIDFLTLALEGIENYSCCNFPSGIGRVIESLVCFEWVVEALFGWTAETHPQVFPQDKDESRKAVSALRNICEKWLKGELLDGGEIEKLKRFFLAISRITLREANKVLDS